jgi:hypothetical protein
LRSSRVEESKLGRVTLRLRRSKDRARLLRCVAATILRKSIDHRFLVLMLIGLHFSKKLRYPNCILPVNNPYTLIIALSTPNPLIDMHQGSYVLADQIVTLCAQDTLNFQISKSGHPRMKLVFAHSFARKQH